MKKARILKGFALTAIAFALCFCIFGAEPVYAVEATEEQPIKQGLVEENGAYYFYNEDGTLFTDGYKVITIDGKRTYYYFQSDGTAYTDGYLNFEVDGKQYYFYFTEDGSAFTDGYKEITIDGKLCYFYFLANGQGFNTGYKTVMIDGRKYYFFFDDNAQAKTDTLEAIPLGDRTGYMLFEQDGKAYTQGYKEIANGNDTDYYYFLSNGQAFTTGYKTVKIDGVTYYYFFEDDGQAFTDGLKAVPFGTVSFYYYFAEDGRAYMDGWETLDGKEYYFQSNGRAAYESFLSIDGKRYYFDDNFSMVKDGWFCVGDGYYFARPDGALATNTVVDEYRLDANGKSRTKYRIIQYVNQITNDSMTDQEKIYALFHWVETNGTVYISSYEYVRADWNWADGWMDDFATDVMDDWGGNCFKFSAFLGLMVKEATDLPITFYCGKLPNNATHGWFTVNQDGAWYLYDVQQAKRGREPSTVYKVPYPGSELHLSGAVIDQM